MKKLYIQPLTDVCELLPTQMLAGSVTGTGAAAIGWGGEDTNPNAGADVKQNYDVWDDDWSR